MQYGTTKKFLEIFGLRNLKELPTLSQIDELLPEGMTEDEAKPTLNQLTDSMSHAIASSYSDGEEELSKITDQLGGINTSSNFFETEKLRQKQKRDAEKAQTIRDAMAFNEPVTNRDKNWLTKYDEALSTSNAEAFAKMELQAEATAMGIPMAVAVTDSVGQISGSAENADTDFESDSDDDDGAEADLALDFMDDDDDAGEANV